MAKVPNLRRIRLLAALLALAALGLSCNYGTGQGRPFASAEGTGYVFLGDAPPPGTSILKFEVTLSSATLCPAVSAAGECGGIPQVEMLSSPIRVDLTQLQLQSAFLSMRNAPAGSYAGVHLVFSNPVIKVLLPNGTIRELSGVNLPLNPASLTPTFSSPVTVGDNTNFGFLIDFDVNDSVQSLNGNITGIAPSVSLVTQSFVTGQPVIGLEDTIGRVVSLSKNCATGTGSFTLNDSLTGVPVAAVQFDSTTVFIDGSSGITCDTLTNSQFVEAEIELRSESAETARFFARRIALFSDVSETVLEGIILQVDTETQFVLFVTRSPGLAGFSNGAIVTVSFDPLDIVFSQDADGLPADPALFSSGAQLLAGQSVELDLVGSTVGTDNCADVDDACAAIVDEIKLKKRTVTATVGQTIVQPNFALVNLPSIFGASFPLLLRPISSDCQNCVIDTISVLTSAETEFEGIPGGFSGLLNGSTVTVLGPLLKDGFQGPGPTSAGFPLIVAERVRLVPIVP